MALLPILEFPDPRLRTKAAEVSAALGSARTRRSVDADKLHIKVEISLGGNGAWIAGLAVGQGIGD